MFHRKITALVATAFAALALTACDPQAIDGKPVPTTTTDLADAGVDSGWLTTEVPEPLPVADPLSSDGDWLVPQDIAPGTYRAIERPGSWMQYIEVCADITCDWDLDGNDSTGMIKNYSVDGTTFVVIPPHAAMVKLDGVVLTLAG